MARYIGLDDAIRVAIKECVKVVGHGITQIDAVNIATALEEISTADVAPREEVDKMISKIKDATFHYYDADIDELKKKYTEVTDDKG